MSNNKNKQDWNNFLSHIGSAMTNSWHIDVCVTTFFSMGLKAFSLILNYLAMNLDQKYKIFIYRIWLSGQTRWSYLKNCVMRGSSFNNYVDQILPDFEPLPQATWVDKNGHFTYYLPFVTWPPVDFLLTPPLIVNVVIEWPYHKTEDVHAKYVQCTLSWSAQEY